MDGSKETGYEKERYKIKRQGAKADCKCPIYEKIVTVQKKGQLKRPEKIR